MRWLLGRFDGASLRWRKKIAPEITPGPETANSSPPWKSALPKRTFPHLPTIRLPGANLANAIHDSSHKPLPSLPSTSPHLTHFHPPHVSWDFRQVTAGYRWIWSHRFKLGWYTWYTWNFQGGLKAKNYLLTVTARKKNTLQSKENLLDMICIWSYGT